MALTKKEREQLVELLIRGLSSGAFSFHEVTPIIREITDGVSPDESVLADLYDQLKDQPAEPHRKMLKVVQEKQLQACMLGRGVLLAGKTELGDAELQHLPRHIPLEWRNDEHAMSLAGDLVVLLGLRASVRKYDKAASGLMQTYEKATAELLSELRREPSLQWLLDNMESDAGLIREALSQLPEEQPCGFSDEALLDELVRMYREESEPQIRQHILDLVLCHPSDCAAARIVEMCQDLDSQWRACQVLMIRFGHGKRTDWFAWQQYLANVQTRSAVRQQELAVFREQHETELKILAAMTGGSPDVEEVERLRARIDEACEVLQPREFAQIARNWLTSNQRAAILYSKRRAKRPDARKQAPAKVVAPKKETADLAPPPLPAPEPEPSIWQEHVRPFMMEYWYLFAGLALMLVGASLMLFFTWQHWWIRYSLMPVVICVLSYGMSYLSAQLSKRAEELRNTASILRAGAIGLAPINFMALGLFAIDSSLVASGVNFRLGALGVMSLLYLIIYSFGLIRWCRAEHPQLVKLLALPLIAITMAIAGGSALLVARPGEMTTWLPAILYVAFVVVGFAFVRFARHLLAHKDLVDRRLILFFSATLALAFVELFIGLHVFAQILPRAGIYAIMCILAGALALYLEHCLLAGAGDAEKRYEGESFVGYALLLAGVLMGIRAEGVRIATFALAGTIWLIQSRRRQHVAHYWIGLTLLMLGPVCIGALAAFPRSAPWNPLAYLGLAIAIGAGGIRLVAARLKDRELGNAAREFQTVAVIIAVPVATMAQWYFRAKSVPVWTGVALIALAALLAWRALRSERLTWMHSTMAILVLALPYLGCLDMTEPRLEGNTMVFGIGGLSALWLLAVHFKPRPLLVNARSTVLWCFGILAVCVMLLRVMFEGEGVPLPTYLRVMNEIGPSLMAITLIFGAWYSRSLIPAILASAILAVLLPELKVQYRQTAELLGYGSGLGSASAALILAAICYPLSAWKRLRHLQGGDLYMGKTPYPLQRRDATLFTLPLALTAFFLLTKICTWNLARNLWMQGKDTVKVVGDLATLTLSAKGAWALVVAAIAWIAVAGYFRRYVWSKCLIAFSWLVALAGFYWVDLLTGKPALQHAPAILILWMLLIYAVGRYLRNRVEWFDELLAAPHRSGLFAWTLILAVATACAIVIRTGLPGVEWLAVLVPIVLLWATLEGNATHCTALFWFVLTLVLGRVAYPCAILRVGDLSLNAYVFPATVFAAVIQGLVLSAEFRPAIQGRLQKFLAPLRINLEVLVGLLFLAWLPIAPANQLVKSFGPLGLLLMLVLLLLLARRHASAFLAFVACGFTYVSLNQILDPARFPHNLDNVVSPWRLGLFALVSLGLAQGYRMLTVRLKTLCIHPSKRNRVGKGRPFMVFCLLATFPAVLIQLLYFTRERPEQLAASYFCAAALLLLYWLWAWRGFLIISVVMEVLANMHVAAYLYQNVVPAAWGLSPLHVVAFGLVFGMIQQMLRLWALQYFAQWSTVRWREMSQDWYARNVLSFLMRTRDERQRIAPLWEGANVCLVTGVLGVLAFNYLVHPDVKSISSARYVISGCMALASALYLRWQVRRSESPSATLVGIYHFGVAMTGWCIALLIPALREPRFAMLMLMVPALFFWIKSEFARSARPLVSKQYCSGAAVMIVFLSVVYILQPTFQMLLYEQSAAFDALHYHIHSPWLIILGLIALRLHKLGATWWLSFWGGMLAFAGTYFAVTSWAWPDFSPFYNPLYAAFVAIGFAHFAIAALYHMRPLKKTCEEVAGLTENWTMCQFGWSTFATVGVEVVSFVGAVRCGEDSRLVAPLLLLAASVVLHLGIRTGGLAAIVAAAFQVFLAIHMDFFLPSYLHTTQVIWVLAGIWGIYLVVQTKLKQRIPGLVGQALLIVLGGAMLLHALLVQFPGSPGGLIGFMLIALGIALTPILNQEHPDVIEKTEALLLLIVPTWLVFFHVVDPRPDHINGVAETWPWLLAAATLLLTGAAAWVYRRNGASPKKSTEQFRIAHLFLDQTQRYGQVICIQFTSVTGIVQIVLTTILLTRMRQQPFVEIAVLCSINAASAYIWWTLGSELRSAICRVLSQISAFAALLVARHVLLQMASWNHYFDVWAALVASFILTALKQHLDKRENWERLPIMGTMWMLPVATLAWAVWHGLGADITLIVIGLHSLIFSYLGRERSNSPYNALAVGGFVSFIIVLFGHWEIRVLNAYIIPVGLGLLALLQLFRKHIPPPMRNGIRLVVLMTMLGSTGYYAIIDNSQPLSFNITMLVLCLAAMGLGGFLKIRLYVLLGFTGLMVDLASLLYKGIRQLEKAYQMASVGVLFLLIGVAVVLGATTYKLHKAKVDAWLDGVRQKLKNWE